MDTEDFKTIQAKWQDRWRQDKAFEAEPTDKEKFFITTPYPYISGSLHIGHARVVIEADVYSRFARMQGKNVLFPQAFHISGTPVLGISLAIAEGDQAKIDLYASYVRNYVKEEQEVQRIVASFKDPLKIVEFFVPKMQEEFARLGLAVDWRRSFTSGDPLHKALVDWQFRKYKDKGYLVQGKYPILYSLSLNSAVGEDDITEGDTNPVDKNEFSLLKFSFEDGFILAATLRPETMYGQTNMWVNPDIDYVKALVNNETWYASKECAEKLQHQDHAVTIKESVPGKHFIGKTCHAPFVDKDILILPSPHCDPDIGSGFVTSVPSDAPYDWIMLKALQEDEEKTRSYGLDPETIKAIQPIPIITSKGYGDLPGVEICEKMQIKPDNQKKLDKATQEIYKVGYHTGVMRDTCGPYAGMKAMEAKDRMKEALLQDNKAVVFWETSRKAASRDGGKIIISLLDNQWFLDFNAGTWKQDAKVILDKMQIIPEKYRKQFEDVFSWLDKRPCARKRGLGTTLPFDKDWVIESLSDSTLYVSLYPFAHLVKDYGFDQLNSHFFDFVYLGKGTPGALSDHTGIPQDVLQKARKSFQYWYPNDHRHTFNAHLANHLSFLIFAHAAILPEQYWPKKFSFHGMVISEGDKMSKSKGNVVTLLDVTNKYGADAFRAFMCNTTSIDSTINWEEREVERLRKHVSSVLALLQGFRLEKKDEPKHPSFISKFHRAIKEATEALQDMNLRQYSMIVLYQLFADVKKELQKLSEGEQEALGGYVLEAWLKLLLPLIPHYAEELWEQTGHENLLSLESWPVFEEGKIDPQEEYKELLLDNLLSDIRTVQGLAKIEKPQQITLITPAAWKYAVFARMKELLKETRNTGEIIRRIMESDLRQHHPKLASLVPQWVDRLPGILLPLEEEQKLIQDAVELLQQRFSCTVVVEQEEQSSHGKAGQSLPAKPAIVLS